MIDRGHELDAGRGADHPQIAGLSDVLGTLACRKIGVASWGLRLQSLGYYTLLRMSSTSSFPPKALRFPTTGKPKGRRTTEDLGWCGTGGVRSNIPTRLQGSP